MIEFKNIDVSIDNQKLISGELKFYEGQLTVLYGNSGTGKTTLLYSLGLLDDKNRYGTLKFSDDNGEEISVSKKDIGYVFQDCSLHNDLTVKENMEFYNKISGHVAQKTAKEYLKLVNLDIDMNRKIATLSGGQRQRVDIAAALYKNIKYLILDEPTSYLDNKNCKSIIELLSGIAHELGLVVIVVTHDKRFIEIADRLYLLEDKEIKLIKESAVKTNKIKEVIKRKSNAVGFYAKHTFINTRKKLFLQNLFISIIIAFSAIFLGYIESFNIMVSQKFNDLSKNELKLAYSQMDKDHFNMYGQGISLNTINSIKTNNYIKNIYPFYELTGYLGDSEIVIQSYYNNELMDKYTDEVIKTKSNVLLENEMLTSGGYIYVNDKISNLAGEQKLVLDLPINDKYECYQVKLTISINAVLSPTYQNQYSSRGNNIVYLPYNLLDSIYQQYYSKYSLPSNKYEPTMYLINFDNLKNINSIIKTIKTVDSNLQGFFETDINHLLNLNENIISMRSNTIYIVIATVIVLELYFRFNRFIHQRKELGLIKANGLSNFKTTSCIGLKNIYQNIMNIIIIIIIITIVDIFISKIELGVYFLQILIALGIIVFNDLVEFVFIFIYLSLNNVRKILR